MNDMKITIKSIKIYIPTNVVIFEIDSSTGLMQPDFGTIYEAFDYLNWYHNEKEYELVFSSIEDSKAYSNIKDLLNRENQLEIDSSSIAAVVGSIEFTERYLGRDITAINIPEQLRIKEFTGRNVTVIHKNDLKSLIKSNCRQLFVKDATRNKKFLPFICKINTEITDDVPSELIVSEVVDFVAEYRAFIYRGNILDCKQYLGSYTVRYDETALENMIKQWENKPIACTLDIGVLSNGETVVIEAHNFLCCGLYGFSGDKLAYMTLNAFREEKMK